MSHRCGFPLSAFTARRQALLQYVGESGVAIIPTAPECRRNRDVYFPFRPSSDFVYLTGFAEPESVLVCVPGRPEGECILFCRPKDPEREVWDGYRVGVDAAAETLGVDQAFRFDQLLSWVRAVQEKVRTGIRAPDQFLALQAYLHEARLLKSTDELAIMQQAADISVRAHRKAMTLCQPGLHEYHLESALMAEFLAGGARSSAYASIVGSGQNGCVLHYIENDAPLNAGDLVLIDAGAELHYYAADITRTFPVSGTFSGEQKALYEVVLQAQRDAIAAVKVGALWSDYDACAVRTLVSGLVDLGLL
ncbi:MAG: aminopeptidase P N-terminal domain-containing protein, partial [Gammaproteobacteria bacterium]